MDNISISTRWPRIEIESNQFGHYRQAGREATGRAAAATARVCRRVARPRCASGRFDLRMAAAAAVVVVVCVCARARVCVGGWMSLC